VSGETLDGDPLDLADLRGSVVVVNVWGAWCTECLEEAPLLVDAADELPAGTEMLGIDIRDLGKDQPRGFERKFGVPYPSLYDPGSETLLKFPAPFNPRATPSTLVLDRRGRVAAVVSGVLPSKLTLLDLVEEVAAEDG
jgi:thiol-disulfide isomerase/thioredoxin